MGTTRRHSPRSTLRAVLEGRSSPLRGPLQLPEGCKMPVCHLASRSQSAGPQQLSSPILFLALSHLLRVMQAWCQALEQLPFSSSRACQPKEAQPHLFAVAAHE